MVTTTIEKSALFDSVLKSNFTFSCKVTDGIGIRKEGYLILKEPETSFRMIVLKIKRVSGNGKITVRCGDFKKDLVVANTTRIDVPTNGPIEITRPVDAVGEVSLVEICTNDTVLDIERDKNETRLFREGKEILGEIGKYSSKGLKLTNLGLVALSSARVHIEEDKIAEIETIPSDCYDIKKSELIFPIQCVITKFKVKMDSLNNPDRKVLYDSSKDQFRSVARNFGGFRVLTAKINKKSLMILANSEVRIQLPPSKSSFLKVSFNVGNISRSKNDFYVGLQDNVFSKSLETSNGTQKASVVCFVVRQDVPSLIIFGVDKGAKDSIMIDSVVVSEGQKEEYDDFLNKKRQQEIDISKAREEQIMASKNLAANNQILSKQSYGQAHVLEPYNPNDPRAIINSFLVLVKTGQVTFHKGYGSPDIVYHDVEKMLLTLLDKVLRIKERITNDHMIVFDYAGIGDVVHSRLVVQNLAPTNPKIAWIVPPITVGLYKDDSLVEVFEGISSRFRNPYDKGCLMLSETMDKVLRIVFPKNRLLNIPNNIGVYLKNHIFPRYDDLWFQSNKIRRDFSIKHRLDHHGKLSDLNLALSNKYLVIEHSSISYGRIPTANYEVLVSRVKRLGMDCIYVGDRNDPPINGAIDGRGFSLYDTVTLIKNSAGFVCRGSGNECLSVFCPGATLFEVGLSNSLTDNKGYADQLKVHRLSKDNFADYIYTYYKQRG